MSNDMYIPALPAIISGFFTSAYLVQLTITAWLAGDAAVQLWVGPISDKYGRRPVLFGGGLLFLLATAGCALSPDIYTLILSRFVQGIGVCTMMVAGYASIHELHDDKEAIKILAWMGSAAIIAPAVGPVIGSYLLNFGDWRMLFWVIFGLSVFSLIGLWVVMPEKNMPKDTQSIDFLKLHKIYGQLIRNPRFMFSALSYGLLYGCIFAWVTASPIILMQGLKLSPQAFGWCQVPVFGGYILGTRCIKSLMLKKEMEGVIRLGLVLTSIAAICLVVATMMAPEQVLSIILPMTLLTFGFGISASSLNRITLSSVLDKRGTAVSLFYFTMVSMGTLGSFALSFFEDTPLSMGIVIAAMAGVAFALNRAREVPA